jgi:hypothetical protein
MKLAVDPCDPGPARFGPILAVPRIRSPSTATTVSPGDTSTQVSCACAEVSEGSYVNVSAACTTCRTIGQTCAQSQMSMTIRYQHVAPELIADVAERLLWNSGTFEAT